MIVTLVAADLTKRVAYEGCVVKQITVWNANSSSDRFIQLFEQQAVANNDIPTRKAYYAPAETQAVWTFPDGIPCAGLTVGVSTTEDKYTAPSAAQGVDMTIVVETVHPILSSFAVAGDLVTPVSTLQVWANAAGGTKKLLGLAIGNNSGADAYAVVQASDVESTLDDQVLIKVPDNTVVYKSFGRGGYSPYRKEVNGTVHRGCSVFMANVVNGFLERPFVIIPGTDFLIRAHYEG